MALNTGNKQVIESWLWAAAGTGTNKMRLAIAQDCGARSGIKMTANGAQVAIAAAGTGTLRVVTAMTALL